MMSMLSTSKIAQRQLSDLSSGEGGIRTHGGSRPTTILEMCADSVKREVGIITLRSSRIMFAF